MNISFITNDSYALAKDGRTGSFRETVRELLGIISTDQRKANAIRQSPAIRNPEIIGS